MRIVPLLVALVLYSLASPYRAAAVERPKCYDTAKSTEETTACYRKHIEILRKALSLQEKQLETRWLEGECDGKEVFLNDAARKAAEQSNALFEKMMVTWRSYIELRASWIASRPLGRATDLDAYAYGISEYQKMLEALREQSYRQTDCGPKKAD